MQLIERQSRKALQYQTPRKKNKAQLDHSNDKRSQTPHHFESNIKKTQFVYTPSTGQLTSNYNTILVNKQTPLKKDTIYVAQTNSQNMGQKTSKASNHQNSNEKIKIRLFKQNTAKKDKHQTELILIQQPIFQASRSKSKSKKGLSLIKNLVLSSPTKNKIKYKKSFQQPLSKQDITNPQIKISSTQLLAKQTEKSHKKDETSFDERLSQFCPVKKLDFFLNFVEREVQICYCKHFLIKIYGKVLRDWKVSKLCFGLIMLQEGLISDLVKERHLVQKIWVQIGSLISDHDAENIEIGIVFAFLASVMGYPMEEINLFNYLELLYLGKKIPQSKFQRQVFNHFRSQKLMFSIKRLSTPKKF